MSSPALLQKSTPDLAWVIPGSQLNMRLCRLRMHTATQVATERNWPLLPDEVENIHCVWALLEFNAPHHLTLSEVMSACAIDLFEWDRIRFDVIAHPSVVYADTPAAPGRPRRRVLRWVRAKAVRG